MTASYSSSTPVQKKLYDVFISFRGEDTRHVFTCHLYRALSDKKIKVYLDEEDLEKGDEISPAIIKAIQESKISVVVLSENYALSSWCLEELRHILQCKEIDEQVVVPIFYHVDPSDVRRQQASYAATFTALEQRFRDEMDKVQQWRKALTSVSNLSGWDSSVIRSESILVEEVVQDVVRKLNGLSSFHNCTGSAEIGRQPGKVESLLNVISPEVRIEGVNWGPVVIDGKIILDRDIFDRFASQFEAACSFLENTKEEIKRSRQRCRQKAPFFGKLGKESSTTEFAKNRLLRTKSHVKDFGTHLGSKTKKARESIGSQVRRPFRKGKKGMLQLEAEAEGVGFDDSNITKSDELAESSETAGSGEKGESGVGIN